MATTSLWPIKNRVSVVIDYARNPEKTVDKNLAELASLHKIGGVIEYAADEMKTERRAFVTCLNCFSEETAAHEFMDTKLKWEKTEGRQCFHGYQSFKAGEVDAETAHEVGVELAKKVWGDRFQVVIATHCNTNHYHNHFVINSVSDVDGLHYDNKPEDYRYMREVSDWLCRKYRLSVIDNSIGHGKSYGEYAAERNGKPTVRGMIRADIDNAIKATNTREAFFSYLEAAGYRLKLYKEDGDWLEYPALMPPGAKGYFRFHKLGQGYSLDELEQRIWKKLTKEEPFPEEDRRRVKERRAQEQPQYHKRTTGLHGLYLRYCYELHIIAEFPASASRVSFFMREDLTKLDRLDQQTRLLGEHQISTGEELISYRQDLNAQIDTLCRKRVDLKNDMRRRSRQGDSDGAAAVKAETEATTKRIRELRKEVSLCDDILTRSAQTREELEWLIEQQESEKKEEQTNELFGRRGRTGREDEFGRR